jgi:ABC-type sulfate transport system permease component
MKKIIFILFAIILLLAFLFQLWLEVNNYVDSIGLWYTFYCAVIYSVILMIIVTPAVYLLRKFKSKVLGEKILQQK